MGLEKVSRSVLAHTGGETRGNVAFIDLGDFIVAVDSGMFPPVIERFREEAEKFFGKKVKYLVITHYHGDHVFGNQVFEDCTIVAAEKTVELMRNRMGKEWSKERLEEFIKNNPEYAEKLKDLRIVLPNKTFEGKFLVEGSNGKIEVVEVGGHCEGSAFVYFEKEKVLIAGDLYFADMWPYGGDPTADPFKWISALEEMISRDFNVVVPGHGPVKNRSDLERYLELMRELVQIIEKYVKLGKSVEDILNSDEVGKLKDGFGEEMGLMEPTITNFYEKISRRFK